MELEVTRSRLLKVWWALTWRNFVALLVAAIPLFVVGIVIGILAHFLNIPVQAARYSSFVIGLMIGLGISIVPVKMVLAKDYGEFRLVLLAKQHRTLEPA